MNQRYHGLDFTRAVLMFLGIFYHSSLIFTVEQNWLVSSESSSELFSVLASFLHLFRMEAFYILAGFFFFLLLEKKPLKIVLISRAKVILIPLFFVGFTLNFIMNGLSENREYTYDLYYVIKGQWLGHLWFIGNLFVYYFISLIFKGGLLRLSSKNSIVIGMISLILIPLLSLALTWIGVRLDPSAFLFVKFVYLFKYFPYFLLGMYFYICKENIFLFMNAKTILLLIGLISCCLLLAQHFDGLNYPKLYKLLTYFYSGYIALLSIIVLNFCFSNSNKYLQKVVDSSYSVYLLHQPVILILFYFVFSKVNSNVYITYILLCISTLFLTFIFHYYVINKTALSLLLFNGKSRGKNKLSVKQ